MYDKRNPEEILKEIVKGEAERKIGKLKIFFGYAAGSGKTYAMLEAARELKKSKVDIVAGYIEPHDRPETIALMEGLELLKPKIIKYSGIEVKEFDLEEAIKRSPEIILIDELAHTNAPDLTYKKRYQDILELLEKGISVYTTVNVQHIESLTDLVASITHVIVKERIPDYIFDSACSVELIDIEPDELQKRMREGKIYRFEKIDQACHNFFCKDNLTALREIALKRCADRVNKEIILNKAGAKESYYAGEHVLIGISASPSNVKVIRTAARMAEAFHASFTALFVESPDYEEKKKKIGFLLDQNIKLAQQLGAKVITIYGESIPFQIAEYAKQSGVTKIVIGRPISMVDFLKRKRNLIDQLAQLVPEIDLYVIPDCQNKQKKIKHITPKLRFKEMLITIFTLLLCTLVGFLVYYFGMGETNIISIYLLGVLSIATFTRGSIYSTFSSIISVVIFNFFFTNPRFTLQYYDKRYMFTFFVMLMVSFVIGSFTIRLQDQKTQALRMSLRTEILFNTSKMLQKQKSIDEILVKAVELIQELLHKTVILFPIADEEIGTPIVYQKNKQISYINNKKECEKAVVNWVLKNKHAAGATTDILPNGDTLYMPIGEEEVFAVIGIILPEKEVLGAFERNILKAMLTEITLSIEKRLLNKRQNKILLQAEKEKLRSNLLRSISHDLRTPLAGITGSASFLLEGYESLDKENREALLNDILNDSTWMSSLVDNLLNMTRIQEGRLIIHNEEEVVEDIISEAVSRVEKRLDKRKIEMEVPDELLLVPMDGQLIIQVLVNLIDNSIKSTLEDGFIKLRVTRVELKEKNNNKYARFEVIDDGTGIDKKISDIMFESFTTTGEMYSDSRRGIGLGLSISKAIIQAHNGYIGSFNNVEKGATVYFVLPMKKGEDKK